ncbi:MAG TPA: hypothetical protein VG713_00825, partial [Pirellulales bacterium]|nr:hypothetical protein [Pirellulales bacterium]
RLESDEVAWVGHAPEIGQMVAGLIGGNGAHIEMAKGAVAAIEFEGSIEPNGGNLLWMVDAKVLGA